MLNDKNVFWVQWRPREVKKDNKQGNSKVRVLRTAEYMQIVNEGWVFLQRALGSSKKEIGQNIQDQFPNQKGQTKSIFIQ